MKVLIINTSFDRGGAAKVAKSIYNGLRNDKEIDINFFYGRGEKNNNRSVKKNIFTFETLIHFFLLRFFGIEGKGSFFSTLFLKLNIKFNKFHLIHLHNIHGYYLNFSFLKFLNSSGIPVIWTFHDVWPLTGRCAYFFDCTKWKNGCYDCPYKNTYPKTFVDSSLKLFKKKKQIFTGLNNLTIITPSNWLKNVVKKSYLKNKNLELINNGVDIDIFKVKDKLNSRKNLNILQRGKYIIYIAAGIDDKRKGFGYFIDVLGNIGLDFTVLIVGKMSDRSREMLKEFNYIYFNKINDVKKLVNVYNAADIFVNTAVDDNFPNTVLESMACGIPVVSFKTGGIPEQVGEDCGVLIEKGDVRDMARAIMSLFENNSELKRMSECSRTRIERSFSSKQMLDNYRRIYLKNKK